MSVPPPPPQPPAPVGTTAASPGPSRKWYLIPLFLVILIGLPSVIAFLNGLDGITNGLTRVSVPGETELSLDEGQWTVFYEWKGDFEGEPFFTSTDFPGMTAVVVSEDGDQIPVVPAIGSFDYNVGGRAGFSVGQFDIDEPGNYVFSATHADPASTEEFVVALGKDIGRSTLMLVFGIIGMIVAGGIAFIVWLVIIILRVRGKRRAQMAGYSAA